MGGTSTAHSIVPAGGDARKLQSECMTSAKIVDVSSASRLSRTTGEPSTIGTK